MTEGLPDVSSIKEFAFLLIAGAAAGFILYWFDRLVTPQLTQVGVPMGTA